MRPFALCPVLALAALLGASPARAADDDSRLGDETAVNEAGECAVEFGVERDRRRRSTERGRSVEFACGIPWGSEVALTASQQRAGREREDELVLELKTELVAARPGRLGWAAGIGFGATREPGRRWRHSEWEAVVEATLPPAERWLAEFAFGVARDRAERRHRTLWSAAIEHSLVDETLELRAEAAGDDRSKRTTVLVGLRWLFSEDAHLKVEYGGRNGPERARVLRIGLKFEFDLD